MSPIDQHGFPPPSGTSYEELIRGFAWAIPDRYNAGADALTPSSENAIAAIHIGPAGASSLSFAQVRAAVDGVARAFFGLGFEQGARIAFLVRSTPDAVIAMLGALQAGLVAVPIAWDQDRDGVAAALRAVSASAIVYDAAAEDRIGAIGAELHLIVTAGDAWRGGRADAPGAQLADMIATPGHRVAVPTSSSAPALISFTSGSTGTPKPAVLAHRFVPAILPSFSLLTGLGPRSGDTLYTSLGWNGLGGLRSVVLPAWRLGCTVVAAEAPLEPDLLLRALDEHGVTNANLMPGVLKRFRELRDSAAGLARLRTVYYAGEPLGPQLQAWIEVWLGISINAYYGATEAAMVVASCRELFPHRPLTVGRPVPGHRVEVLDPATLEPLPAGTDGVIAVGRDDPGLFVEYFGRPDLTAAAYTEHHFITNDIGHLDDAGNLCYVGRRGEIAYGANGAVPLVQLEDALLASDAVRDAAAVHVTSARGTWVVLFVVPAGEPGQGRKDDVRAHLDAALPRGLPNARIEFVDALPKTPGTGKIKRAELRRRAEEMVAKPPP